MPFWSENYDYTKHLKHFMRGQNAEFLTIRTRGMYTYC